MIGRDIRARLGDLRGRRVSPDPVGRIADAVRDEGKDRRSRAPDTVCPGGS